MSDELAFMPALEQAARVRSGELSPTDLVDATLERIERINPSLDAFLTVAAEQARAAARAAEARLHDPDPAPPFLGVPISIWLLPWR